MNAWTFTSLAIQWVVLSQLAKKSFLRKSSSKNFYKLWICSFARQKSSLWQC